MVNGGLNDRGNFQHMYAKFKTHSQTTIVIKTILKSEYHFKFISCRFLQCSLSTLTHTFLIPVGVHFLFRVQVKSNITEICRFAHYILFLSGSSWKFLYYGLFLKPTIIIYYNYWLLVFNKICTTNKTFFMKEKVNFIVATVMKIWAH